VKGVKLKEMIYGILGVIGILATINIAVSEIEPSISVVLSIVFLGALLTILWKS